MTELDAAVVERAQKGDRNAFEAIVTAYEKPLYNYALRLLRSPEDAADAVQDAFVKVYTGLGSFRGDSRLSTWLFRILNNVCVDALRARSETASLTAEDENGEETELEIPDERFDPAAVLERQDLRERVRRGVELLPEDFKKPLLLREFGGLSYDEIAVALALDPGTVKTRIFRARKKLCAILLQDGNFSEKKPSKDQKGGVRA